MGLALTAMAFVSRNHCAAPVKLTALARVALIQVLTELPPDDQFVITLFMMTRIERKHREKNKSKDGTGVLPSSYLTNVFLSLEYTRRWLKSSHKQGICGLTCFLLWGRLYRLTFLD